MSCSSLVLSFVRQRGSQKEALRVTSKPGILQITPFCPSLFHSPEGSLASQLERLSRTGAAAFPHTSPAISLVPAGSSLTSACSLQQSSTWPLHVHLRQGLGEAARSGRVSRDVHAGGERDALSQHLCAGDREAAESRVPLLPELLPWALAVPSKEHLACRSL